VQVQEEAAHGVLFREHVRLRALLKEAAAPLPVGHQWRVQRAAAAMDGAVDEAGAEGAAAISAALGLFGEALTRTRTRTRTLTLTRTRTRTLTLTVTVTLTLTLTLTR
jgi:hypothetical protein